MSEPTDGAIAALNITYPEDLPIAQKREEIAAAIRDHQVVVVAGETGSGKTTQLPKICLELGRGRSGLIGHTQPRRLAARNVAARIASELGTETGDLVGYQVRFNERVSATTQVKLMTDGILLSEMQRDRQLARYDTLIIDEAHERSLNIDFLLGYLKRLLPSRPDLKVIVTSATIDVEGFSRFFDGAPIIEVSGRSFPIETVYVPDGLNEGQGKSQSDDEGEGQAGEESSAETIAALLEEVEAETFGPRGDALVFLPGEREIRELAKALRGFDRIEVLPLYARLSQAEQNRVFDPARRRSGMRVILATNVAETSLTVPGIRYVIDPGFARISRYSHRSKIQRLPVEPVSQASADQRRGRCGRVGPGVCLRLYSQADYNARPEFTVPEIQRTNLASVVLQMLSLGFGEIQHFPFLEPPDSRLVRDGYKVLEELGAVTPGGKLTGTGRRMARFPVDPRLSRMILQADRENCLAEILIIASALSVQDPRERPADKQQQADQMHVRYRHAKSDFMSWLEVWRYFEEQRQSLTQNQLRKLCKREFLSYTRMREWRDVHMQLRIVCRAQKMKVAEALPEEENYREVHRALLSGLLTNLGQLQEGREYLGARNRRFYIFPGSSQARKPPAWLVSAEVVETSRVYARQVAGIDPRWALDLNPDLLKRHYYDASWNARSGRVNAYERITLYGLTLVDKQRVHYGPIAPQESRELLITHGLVGGSYQRFPTFLRHNHQLARDILELEARSRRRDLLVEDRELIAFYDDRLPADIYTARGLESWLKKNPDKEKTLYMQRDTLLARAPTDNLESQFPQALTWQGAEFKLTYEFQPGQEADGVSVTVPVALLNRTPRYLFDWLVPGLLREKCIALVKGLPKEKRKHFVPVPDYVDRALDDMEPADTDLSVALGASLNRLKRVALQPADWSLDKLDDYYRMNVRVVDAQGKLLGQGRDLGALLERYREDTRHSISTGAESSPAREGILTWDFDDLPERWEFRQAGVDIVAWPALADQGDSVAIQLCDYPGDAQVQHRLGLLRLFRLQAAQTVKAMRKQLFRGNDSQFVLVQADCARDVLVEDLIDSAFVQVLSLNTGNIRTERDFRERLAQGRGGLVARAVELENTLLLALKELAETRRLLARMDMSSWADTQADIDLQIAELLTPHGLRDAPAQWLDQFPRYFKALRVRVERLSGQYAKDQTHRAMLEALREPLRALLDQRPGVLFLNTDIADYRWLLEEFRVSLFAQNLGTKMPVSQKRLLERWRNIQAWLADNPQ